MKNKTGLFLLTAFLALVLIGTFFEIPAPDRAFAASNAVTGYAWSENIGWIHFNPPLGGVFLDDSTGNFSGYAWSENIGWVDFGPSAGFPAAPNYGAKADLTTGKVTGWAKAVEGGSAQSGGWDGWIKMSGSVPDYGVSIDLVGTGNFSGWAWASDVVGWIAFSGDTSGAGGGDYKVSITPIVFTPPTLDFSASPNPVAYNTASTLTWSSANATACTASGDWSGAKAVSGSQSTGNFTSSKTYTLSCTGLGGTVIKSVTVTIDATTIPDFSLNNSGAILATIIGSHVKILGGSLISVSSQNGFSDSVSLSITSVAPSITGASHNLNDLLLTSAEYAVGSTLTVSNIPASVSPGTYVITVQGVGGGITRTVTVNLQIETLNPTWREI
jgi:hypothetical protein